MIVFSPALDIAPGDGLILRIGNSDREVLFGARGTGLCCECQTDDRCCAQPRTARPASVDHCPASVATSFQLGSREDRSRAKVHTSVTSVTLSGLPSITFPARSLVVEISCETKRIVICAVPPRCSAPMISVLSIDTNLVSTVSPLFSRS